MRLVNVSAKDNEYAIYIGRGAIDAFSGVASHLFENKQVAVIADGAVADLHLSSLLDHLPRTPVVITFPPGEQSKSLETVRAVYERLADGHIERDAMIVAFGGGVATDLGGFVAATWHRGMRSVLVPTTLLAAVDAAVGGKTGVNLTAGKNLIGAFHQPAAVVADTELLQTTSQRHFTSGLAESVKMAAVRSPNFLAWHEEHVDPIVRQEPGVVEELIARNCELKAEIVRLDEREAGLRAILNYGHTVGHALEHLLEYTCPHGECVAWGIRVENALAVARGMLPPRVADRVGVLLERLGLPLRLPRAVDPAAVAALCRSDKKVRAGRVNCILLRDAGQPERVADVAGDELRTALAVVQPT
ncbi:MAG: 3-dehydroquinate synthase [Planctomycetota bacterium]